LSIVTFGHISSNLLKLKNPFPSPIPEESNGNSLDSEILSMHSRFRPRSHKRRHTVSDVQQDLAHARIDLSDNRYRDLCQAVYESVVCGHVTWILNVELCVPAKLLNEGTNHLSYYKYPYS
jgi:hypothetical protein